jgi:hypothetical protein
MQKLYIFTVVRYLIMKNFVLVVAAILIIAGAILEGASLTGMAAYEDVAGELCLKESDCSGKLACCPVKDSSSGICYSEQLCSSVYYFTEADRITNLDYLKQTSSRENGKSSALVAAILFMLGLGFVYLYLNLPHVQVLDKKAKKRSARH